MHLQQVRSGDAVRARTDIFNDGSHPELPDGGCIARAGTLGMLIEVGQLEEEPGTSVYLVRFERPGPQGVVELGPPVGCWAEEIDTPDPRTE